MTDPADFFSAVTALSSVKELDEAALRLLYRVECSGEDFYNLIADRIADPRAADLLRKNAREERGHAERVRRALGVKRGQDYEPTDEDHRRLPVFLPDEIPVDLFSMIVQGELDGDAGYQRWAERETDPEVQRLLRLNGREETTHGERVREVIAILRSAQLA